MADFHSSVYDFVTSVCCETLFRKWIWKSWGTMSLVSISCCIADVVIVPCLKLRHCVIGVILHLPLGEIADKQPSVCTTWVKHASTANWLGCSLPLIFSKSPKKQEKTNLCLIMNPHSRAVQDTTHNKKHVTMLSVCNCWCPSLNTATVSSRACRCHTFILPLPWIPSNRQGRKETRCQWWCSTWLSCCPCRSWPCWRCGWRCRTTGPACCRSRHAAKGKEGDCYRIVTIIG